MVVVVVVVVLMELVAVVVMESVVSVKEMVGPGVLLFLSVTGNSVASSEAVVKEWRSTATSSDGSDS
uniref:Putative secreted protein n=1 Tax=Anopheles darlingi TaxID=43151 RepID=A0A2M4D8K4_ANODA